MHFVALQVNASTERGNRDGKTLAAMLACIMKLKASIFCADTGRLRPGGCMNYKATEETRINAGLSPNLKTIKRFYNHT